MPFLLKSTYLSIMARPSPARDIHVIMMTLWSSSQINTPPVHPGANDQKLRQILRFLWKNMISYLLWRSLVQQQILQKTAMTFWSSTYTNLPGYPQWSSETEQGNICIEMSPTSCWRSRAYFVLSLSPCTAAFHQRIEVAINMHSGCCYIISGLCYVVMLLYE